MAPLLLTLSLLLSSPSHARENDPDLLPPPVLEAEPSLEPELVTVRKKGGRSLASEGKPSKQIRVNGNVKRAVNQGECPEGFSIADFHGWLCRKN